MSIHFAHSNVHQDHVSEFPMIQTVFVMLMVPGTGMFHTAVKKMDVQVRFFFILLSLELFDETFELKKFINRLFKKFFR